MKSDQPMPPPVEGRVAYIDTVQIPVRRALTRNELARLQPYCRSVLQFRRQIPDWRYRYRLLIQLPQPAFFHELKNLVRTRYCVNRVDLANDLIVADVAQARLIGEFCRNYQGQRWHGNRQRSQYQNTMYWARDRWTRRNFAVYADRPCKLTDEPCCHIEYRIRRADACRRAGFSTIDDFINIDHRGIWEKELRFEYMPEKALERLIENMARRSLRRQNRNSARRRRGRQDRFRRFTLNTVDDWIRRVRYVLFSILQDEDGTYSIEQLHKVPAQVWKEAFGSRLLAGYLRRIPHDSFLPS